MKLLPFFRIHNFFDFFFNWFLRTQFVWMGVFFFNFFVTGWEFFAIVSTCFFVSWNYWLSSERIIWDSIFFMQVFKGALKEAIKEYQKKKYGVSRFPTFFSILHCYFHFEIRHPKKDQEYCTCPQQVDDFFCFIFESSFSFCFVFSNQQFVGFWSFSSISLSLDENSSSSVTKVGYRICPFSSNHFFD